MNILSLFSGMGGLDKGFEEAGYHTLAVMEWQQVMIDTLAHNLSPSHIFQEDLHLNTIKNLLDERNIPTTDVDVIIGGSPCQSFSFAGKRDWFNDVRGRLLFRYLEAVQNIQPKAFLFENVLGFLKANVMMEQPHDEQLIFDVSSPELHEVPILDYMKKTLGNYTLYHKVINSADYGVPQKRKRVFIIGIHKDFEKPFLFPKETHEDKRIYHTNKLPWNSFRNVVNQLSYQPIEHEHMNYSEKRLKIMKHIPKGGGNWKDLVDTIHQPLLEEVMGRAFYSSGGRTGYLRRISLNEPSPTLLTSPVQLSTTLGHPLEDRPLSIEEYKLIQGFPLDYKIFGSTRQKYIQLGNAVPLPVAYILANQIKQYFKKYS